MEGWKHVTDMSSIVLEDYGDFFSSCLFDECTKIFTIQHGVYLTL